jgi:hypothetical protein
MTEQPKRCVNCGDIIPLSKDDLPTPELCNGCREPGVDLEKRKDWKEKLRQAHEQKQKQLENLKNLSKNPALLNIWLDDLERLVKFDTAVKISVLCAGLSAYAKPLNVSLKGESSIGKSYNATNTLAYFPEKDVWFLGGMTPKALIYDHGVLMNKDGDPIDTEKKPFKPTRVDFDSVEDYREAKAEWKEKMKAWKEEMTGSYYEIDLTNKILCFLEPPSFETFEMLKVILSHDKFKTQYKYVNKSKGVNTTINTVLKGWPATVFLGIDKRYMAEFATRTLTVTPSGSSEKISAANKLTNEKSSFPWEFEEETATKTAVKALIITIKELMIKEQIKIVNPFPDLHTCFKSEIARDMRDFEHFSQMLETFALLNIFQRPIIEVKNRKYALITREDVQQAEAVFKEIIETTRTGTESRILEFYKKILLPHQEGLTVEQATKEYNATAKKPLSDYTIRYWLNRLNKIGYADKKKQGPTNEKVNVYTPLTENVENICNSEIQTYLESKIEKDFETWLNGLFEKQLIANKYFISVEGSKEEISIDQLKKNVLELPTGFSNIHFEQENNGKNEKDNGNNGKGKTQTNLEDLVSRTKSIARLDSESVDKCVLCGFQGRMDWQVTEFDNTWGLLCGPCGDKVAEKIGEAS